MTTVDWRTVDLDKGVLREPTPDISRVVLWVPDEVDNGFQHWERISNVPGAEVIQEQEIFSTEATCMPARQRMHGFLGSLFAKLRRPSGDSTWLLPTGKFAEQTGQRQSGFLLVWSEQNAGPLDAMRLQARWGAEGQLRRVGKNLFVVKPAQPGAMASAAATELLGGLRRQAEELLAAARQAGDHRAEASALTDLGSVLLRGGDPQRALVILEEATSIAKRLADRPLENDALGQLALALVAAGQAERAQQILGEVLAYARETGERFGEKVVLANLGSVLASKRDFSEAILATDHALNIAREVGDRHQEADLLWFQAIQNAELGRAERASELAQAAIDIHATLRSPHVGWLTSHLKKYRPIPSRSVLGTAVAGMAPGGYYTGPPAAPPPAPTADCDPGLLHAALTAVKTLEMTGGPGLKVVAREICQERLNTCAACAHHTGMRCKLCGLFTKAKACLAHEGCPVAKWSR
jgi:tetratricopeptide (TPR) repeat protein